MSKPNVATAIAAMHRQRLQTVLQGAWAERRNAALGRSTFVRRHGRSGYAKYEASFEGKTFEGSGAGVGSGRRIFAGRQRISTGGQRVGGNRRNASGYAGAECAKSADHPQ
jgi:hypothetical protein